MVISTSLKSTKVAASSCLSSTWRLSNLIQSPTTASVASRSANRSVWKRSIIGQESIPSTSSTRSFLIPKSMSSCSTEVSRHFRGFLMANLLCLGIWAANRLFPGTWVECRQCLVSDRQGWKLQFTKYRTKMRKKKKVWTSMIRQPSTVLCKRTLNWNNKTLRGW